MSQCFLFASSLHSARPWLLQRCNDRIRRRRQGRQGSSRGLVRALPQLRQVVRAERHRAVRREERALRSIHGHRVHVRSPLRMLFHVSLLGELYFIENVRPYNIQWCTLMRSRCFSLNPLYLLSDLIVQYYNFISVLSLQFSCCLVTFSCYLFNYEYIHTDINSNNLSLLFHELLIRILDDTDLKYRVKFEISF